MKKRGYILLLWGAISLCFTVTGCKTAEEKALLNEQRRLRNEVHLRQAGNESLMRELRRIQRNNASCLDEIQRNVNSIRQQRERSKIFWQNHSEVMAYSANRKSTEGLELDVLVSLGDARLIPTPVTADNSVGKDTVAAYASMPLLKLPQEKAQCLIVDMGLGPWSDEYMLYAFEILLEGDNVKEIALVILDEHNRIAEYQPFDLATESTVSWTDVNVALKWRRLTVTFGREIGFIRLPANHRWGLVVPKDARIPCDFLGLPGEYSGAAIGMNVKVAPFEQGSPVVFTSLKVEVAKAVYPASSLLSATRAGEVRERHNESYRKKNESIMSSLKPSVSMAVYGTVSARK